MWKFLADVERALTTTPVEISIISYFLVLIYMVTG